MQALEQYFLITNSSEDPCFYENSLHQFRTDLSQDLTPEPCKTKTLSDIINSQPQQSLNPKISIATPHKPPKSDLQMSQNPKFTVKYFIPSSLMMIDGCH